ncbi:threonine synthase [Myxococcus stipitatus]|uniref:threonine synthase n=1 Tax=Myxococcus stipitatus TaxID=83455 RepID=UPI001F2D78D5|nr:threonine synthase [Myxococcus stipitatus]MCE9671217.1 threonine synthase [Myxococcus stipitatus]
MARQHIHRLTCLRCGRHHAPESSSTCDACGLEGILDVEYDYERVASTMTPEALRSRAANHWRYWELLPLSDGTRPPSLHLGMTPVDEAPRLAAALGLRSLRLKDETRNPTCSFKDRASSVGVLRAREEGRAAIACASTGNAASSLAGFSAAVGLESFIFVPARAPEPKLAQLLVFGAHVVRVQATYDDAWELCQAACERYGWYNRNCAVNPYLVEGKKTAGLELAEQLGADLPDWVVVSVGDGCTLGGVWKGLQQMHRLGFIPRLPRLLGVQAAGSPAVARAFAAGADTLPDAGADTLADSIAVSRPRNWRRAVRAVRESHGTLVCVEDAEILEAMRDTARLSAIFPEPAAAAATAGLARAVREGTVHPRESAVVLVTGNGLKDTRAALQATRPPLDLPPDLDALDTALREHRLL